MLRRDFLAGVVSLPFTGSILKPFHHGWIPGYQHYSLCSFTDYKGLGKDKIACLWNPWEIIHGSWIMPSQEWYDCVSVVAGCALDMLTATQNQPYRAKANSDMIYAGARNHIADDKTKPGIRGIDAVKWLTKYGVLLRTKYTPYDLTKYSERTCRYWDRRGVPESLRKVAKQTPLLKYIHIKDWEQCRNAIASGHPIIFNAAMGMQNSRRDRDGFCIPHGKWYHSWLLAGVDDGKRPGACLINPHGSQWGSGPKRHNNPNGSVWVDKRYIEDQLKNFRDSYALCSIKETGKRQFFPWLK